MLALVTLRLDIWAVLEILLEIAYGAGHDLYGLLVRCMRLDGTADMIDQNGRRGDSYFVFLGGKGDQRYETDSEKRPLRDGVSCPIAAYGAG